MLILSLTLTDFELPLSRMNLSLAQLGRSVPWTGQAMPYQFKGFGTNLAIYGDRLLHSNFMTDPEATSPLKEYLIDMFTCITDRPNPDRFSLLGMYHANNLVRCNKTIHVIEQHYFLLTIYFIQLSRTN